MQGVIRRAGPGDLAEVLALYAQLNPGDPLPDAASAQATWQAILASAMMSVHVAALDDAIVATCVLVIVPNLTRNQSPFAIIENVVSARSLRGAGFGKRVIHAAFDEAWAAGCYKVMLMTGRADPAVLGFYEACGFERGKTAFQIRRPAGLSSPTQLPT